MSKNMYLEYLEWSLSLVSFFRFIRTAYWFRTKKKIRFPVLSAWEICRGQFRMRKVEVARISFHLDSKSTITGFCRTSGCTVVNINLEEWKYRQSHRTFDRGKLSRNFSSFFFFYRRSPFTFRANNYYYCIISITHSFVCQMCR